MTSTKTALTLLAVVLAAVGAGCGSSNESAAPTTAAVHTPPSTSPSATGPTESIRVAAVAVCNAGGGYSDALSSFVNNGTGVVTVNKLASVKAALASLSAVLPSASSQPGYNDLQSAVRLYTKMNDGLDVLYGKGETAYQPVKASGGNVDELEPQAEDAWSSGVRAMFGTDSPSAPSQAQRTCS